jgi:hypothetical protein
MINKLEKKVEELKKELKKVRTSLTDSTGGAPPAALPPPPPTMPKALPPPVRGGRHLHVPVLRLGAELPQPGHTAGLH